MFATTMSIKWPKVAVFAMVGMVAMAALPTQAYDLKHRWSFTGGSLEDSIGANTAVFSGSGTATYANNEVKLPGGSKGTSCLDLGNNVFPSSGPVTIEIWATQDAVQEWSRIFAIGSADNNKLAMGWSYGTDINTDFIGLKISGSDLVYQRDKMQPYTIGTKYHISMVIVPNGDGKSTLSWAKRDVTTGDILKSGSSVTSRNWTPGDFASYNLWLGHGYSNNDASATYDEVRISSGVVGAEQLTANVILGPDVAVSTGTDNATGFTIPANATFNFPDGAYPGNAFAVSGTVTLEAGAKIVFDTANSSSASMTFSAGGYSLPSGVSSILDMVELTDSTGYEVSLDGTTITVAAKNNATWTGEAGDGEWNTAGNWVDGKVPDAGTAVIISGDAVNLNLPVGTTFSCSSFTIASCTFASDCDWRGLSVTPKINAVANLNGHVLKLNNLEAIGGASFTNTSETDGEVRFYADGDQATVTESTFVTGIENLKTAANAKIAIVRTSESEASGTLDIGAANNHTVFRAENGTLSMTADGRVGMTANGSGQLEIAGGTVDFCTANNRGLRLGGSSGRASMKISAGKLQSNWIDAGFNGVTDCTITQTGGEVKTGINNNGNIWIGKESNGKATYVMSGGAINVTQGSFDVGNNGTGTFTQSGGDVVTGSGDVRVGMYSRATGTYTLNDGNVTPKYWLHVGHQGTGTFIQNGGSNIVTNATINDGNWLCLGESASGNGKYVMNGGYLEAGTGAKGGGIFAGRRGMGRFELNGGTVLTPAFIDQTGRSTVLLNGGTIKVSKDSGTGTSSQHTKAS